MEGLADQGVAEPVALALGHHDVVVNGVADSGQELGWGQVTGLCQQVVGEGAASEGEQAGALCGRFTQRLDPCDQKLPQRGPQLVTR